MSAEKIPPLTKKNLWPEIGSRAFTTESYLRNDNSVNVIVALYSESPVGCGIGIIHDAQEGATSYLPHISGEPDMVDLTPLHIQTFGLAQRALLAMNLEYEYWEDFAKHLEKFYSSLRSIEIKNPVSFDEKERVLQFFTYVREFGTAESKNKKIQ